MADHALNRAEGWGLAISLAGHAALLALLIYRPTSGEIVLPPERVEVTISDDVGLISSSPDPAPPAPSVAPELGEVLPQVEEIFVPLPLPAPPIAEAPRAEPMPRPRPTARPVPRSQPRPASKPAPQPRQTARAAEPPRPSRQPDPKPAARTGGSRVGSDFLEGSSDSNSSSSSSSPAAAITGRVQASLSSAISRQLKPHWTPPQGADAEQLVTFLAWNLNEDGSLSGTPRVVRQSGITDSNQAQAARHAEQAIRAVQLAAPFNLPSQYYAGWKRVSSFRFDIRLSQ